MAQFVDCRDPDERERPYLWLAKMDEGRAYADPDQAQDLVEAYNATMRRVAEDCDAVFIDLPALLSRDGEVGGYFDGMFHDGVHFSERGSRLVARRLAAFLIETVYHE